MEKYEVNLDFLDDIGTSNDELDDDIFSSEHEDPSDSNSFIDEDVEGSYEDEENNSTSSDDNESALISFLKSRGINDPDKLQFQNEDGSIEEISFDELSKEEQLQILNNIEAPLDLSNDEINMLNFFRSNNITLDDYVNARVNQAMQEANNTEQSLYIDQLNDQELFVLDLKYKYPDLTDEELTTELENALEDEQLFEKKVNKLRRDYTELEQKQKAAEETERIAKAEQNYNQLVNSMVAEAQAVEDYHGLILDDQDKDDVLKFLLQKDVNGNTEFYKLLSNPQALFKLAWFASKGDEAFETLHSYYKKEIDKVSRKKESSNQPSTKVVKKRTSNKRGVEDTYDLNKYFK
jgi:hypothetical protein